MSLATAGLEQQFSKCAPLNSQVLQDAPGGFFFPDLPGTVILDHARSKMVVPRREKKKRPLQKESTMTTVHLGTAGLEHLPRNIPTSLPHFLFDLLHFKYSKNRWRKEQYSPCTTTKPRDGDETIQLQLVSTSWYLLALS